MSDSPLAVRAALLLAIGNAASSIAATQGNPEMAAEIPKMAAETAQLQTAEAIGDLQTVIGWLGLPPYGAHVWLIEHALAKMRGQIDPEFAATPAAGAEGEIYQRVVGAPSTAADFTVAWNLLCVGALEGLAIK